MPQLLKLATSAMGGRTGFHRNNALWLPGNKRQNLTHLSLRRGIGRRALPSQFQ
ncbi:transposase IS116/IS110/IS902 family domain protein (plasmid) [Ochrobactrum quorumnocens]|uniref:Transposase IS116/IS110/IS902 family domain protein n=1 Tax=Ochrobactrum quorumnocens TaxID=271865 RepID=A0A248UNV3_9HYPH|nr:transposase IS116/IS110/IS902 family domain protein [[Ochrobactrum] quorumnocens]